MQEVQLSNLNSLFYLALTEIPVRQRFGENKILYNYKTRLVASVDKNGNSILESGGIYTVESTTCELVKNASMALVRDEC